MYSSSLQQFYGNFSLELKLHFSICFVRLSSAVDVDVDTKVPAKHETSYGIQNVRYILQIMTDAVAIM